MYPQIRWVLLGDSGEKDQEIYLKVLQNYPKSVEAIYIRDVETKELKALFKLKNRIQHHKSTF